jgi:hypothetical protein
MNKIKRLDFRTPLQKERDERAAKVYARHLEIKDFATSQWAAWRVIADEFGMKPEGVRSIVIRHDAKKKIKK